MSALAARLHAMQLLTAILLMILNINAQLLLPIGNAQVKISAQPFQVANTQHLSQIVWTMLGRTARETIYCVSEAPVSQLRFVCSDCLQRNITDIVEVLNSAQDLTRTAGFPTIQLQNVEANPTWTGATIICQASFNNGPSIESQPATIDVRYMRGVHVVDTNDQGPVFIPTQGYHFYVECTRNVEGTCQSAQRRKTLRCAVQAHPPATAFRWLKNGGPISGNGPEITVGTEMIGHSLQCSANNGLFGDDMPTSQAVFIDPYSAARVVQTNFNELRKSFYEINQRLSLRCYVEGNPRPVVFWKLRRPNGEVIDALCPQGLNGRNEEIQPSQFPQFQLQSQPVGGNGQIILSAICDLQIESYAYSGTYWCSACSYVSQGKPECSPGVESPGEQIVDVQVQGAPQSTNQEPIVIPYEGENRAIVSVYYCANPAPTPPRDIVFSIDGNDIQLGSGWQNFYFEGFTQNNTMTNCYAANLRIAPINDEDQSRQILLKLNNRYGSKQISISLSDLLGVSNAEIGSVSNWVLILFTVVSAVLILVTALIICMRSQVLCFDQVKDPQAHYSSDKLKSGMHDAYTDDASHGGLFGSGGASSPSGEVIHSNSNTMINSTNPNGIINTVYTGIIPGLPSNGEMYVSREAVV